MKNLSYILSGLFLIFLFGCKTAPTGPQAMSADEVVSNLQKRLIEAQEGETILLPEGTFSFKRPLSFTDIAGVTIKGAGMKKTILSFKDQIEGGEGFNVKNATDITLEDFTIADSKGDALKLHECTNVVIRGMETTWTTGASEENGAYGLYPVFCTNVLMENCEASYAMDAGIYIGQSNNVVIRNNYAHHNVAGIEIENTRVGEVYGNRSVDNTAGMLIFDMPDVPQANGHSIKVYDNVMENNNGENFSAPGIVVNTLPPGTGMVVMASTQVELHNNTISNHKSVGIAVNTWLFTGLPFESKEYDPFNSYISIYDNTITGTQGPPDMTTDLGKLFTAVFKGESFDITVDGIYRPDQLDEHGRPIGICIKNNGDVSFANLNAGMGGTPEAIMKNVNHDMSLFNCTNPNLELGSYDDWIAVE